MVKRKQIGILGGTFDPIHLGHLHVAHEVLQLAHLDQIQFIPVQQPVHRETPLADAIDRLTMLKLALQNEPLFSINTIELERNTPSYTIDTLKALANPKDILYFIMGIDSFLQFNTWHHWQTIIDYCHLIIVNRPFYDVAIPPPLQLFYDTHRVNDWTNCQNKQEGCILPIAIKPCEISATAIRQQLAKHESKIIGLPNSVYEFIRQNHLYKN